MGAVDSTSEVGWLLLPHDQLPQRMNGDLRTQCLMATKSFSFELPYLVFVLLCAYRIAAKEVNTGGVEDENKAPVLNTTRNAAMIQ